MAHSPLLPQEVDGSLIIGIDPTKLAAARRDAGYTQAALAEASGMAARKGYISMLERGVKKPSLGTATRLAEALGVKLTDICVHIPDYPRGAA